jgi:hypothetical protein
MMNPCTCRHADALLNNINKGCDIVIGNSFALTNSGNEVFVYSWCELAASLGMISRYDTNFTVR